MGEPLKIERRTQFCARCGRPMFEYYRSPDGHFGVVNSLGRNAGRPDSEVRCIPKIEKPVEFNAALLNFLAQP